MKKTHVALGILAMAAFVATSTTGCSSDGDNNTGGAGGTGGDGGAGPGPGPGPGVGGSGGTGGTGGTGGGGGMPDESTSCADAPMMEEGMGGLNNVVFVGNGFIGEAGDRDFWKVDATEGDWLNIITIANENDDSAFIDTVIRVYDDTGNTLLATIDDAYPRVTTDSEMFYHVAETGTYCIEVLEFGDWAGSPVDKANNQYSAQVIPVDFTEFEGYDVDTEPNNDSTTANTSLSTTNPQMNNPMSPFVAFQYLGGTFADAADSDWYEITIPAGAAQLSLDMTPDGVGSDGSNPTNGFGSTGGPGLINLYDSTVQLVAAVDNQLLQDGLDGMSSVPVTPGNYFLEVTRPVGATAGANDFYWLRMLGGDDTTLNPQETNDAANNVIGTAETMQANPIDANGFIAHFIGGTITEGDSDFWAFPASGEPAVGEELTVACSSWAAGSGVRGMTVTHYENGVAGKTQVEDEAKGVVWSNGMIGFETSGAITIGSAGPHVIEISNDGATSDTGALAKHYLCGIRRNTMP